MKKVIILTLAVLSIVGLYTSAQTRNGMVLTDTQAAIDFMYGNGLTKFNTTSTFMANSNLRRDEAAAFFARLARDVLGMIPDTSKTECSAFTDLSQGHSDLQGEMIASCQLGLFKGYNGKFTPTASFTNAQALTVIVRLLDGEQSETGAHWASNYLARAKVLGLTSGLSADSSNNLDKYINRGEVARLIEAGSVQGRTGIDYSQEGTAPEEDIEREIGLLKQIYIDGNGTRKLEIDYVQMGGSDQCNGGVTCIINQNPLLRTFTISNNVEITLQTFSHTTDGYYNNDESISFEQFMQELNNVNNNEYPIESIPYRITIENNVVTKIEEQYMS